jgi:putative iron-regulated protein
MIIAVTAGLVLGASTAGSTKATKQAVLETYANIAHAVYGDSLSTARMLKAVIDVLIESPSKLTLMQARRAWLAARVPYQQTEVYRFGNAIVDEWEGRVNSWPLDEGLIDYVDFSYGGSSEVNDYYAVNIIANPMIKVAGQIIDARKISPSLLADTLQEAGGVEANVATGYHAIEFLLWGQDLNGTERGAGNRPSTDFDPNHCTNGNCDRRAAYLLAATELLISDLEEMVANWEPGGTARETLLKGNSDAGLAAIVTGLGSLAYGELAGERMKLGLLLHEPEEEHDCFSDNTHNSHYYNVVGMVNVYEGQYRRVDGTVVSGPSLSTLVQSIVPALDLEVRAKFQATMAAVTVLKHRAEQVEAYDQMIGEGNAAGHAVVQAVIDALIDQTRSIERTLAALGLSQIKFKRSDSLEDPSSIFNLKSPYRHRH